MKKSFVTIDPSILRIGAEAPFRFRRFLPGEEGTGSLPDDNELVTSIARCGVLNPPLLLEEPGGGSPVVVCGHRRVAAARIAGIESIEAISTDASIEEVVPLWLEEAHFGALLSDLELILLISKYRALSGDAFNADRLSDIMGRNLSSSYIERVLRLFELPDDILDALHEGRLSTGDLLMLSESRTIDAARAARLLAGAALKRAERREAVRLLLRLGDLGIFDEFERARGGLEEGLMPALRNACTPSLERDMARIEEIVTRLGLPTGTSLQPSENLEGGHYRLVARVRDERELEELLGKLRAALGRGDIGRLLDILKGRG